MTDTVSTGSRPDSEGLPPSLSPRGGSARGTGGSSVGSATGPGLSAAAATVLAVVVTVAAGVISAATGNGFGAAFNVAYLLVVLYLAFRTRVEDRFTAVVVPPLAYALALGVGSFFDSETPGSGFFLTIQNALVPFFLNAPWLVGATVAAIVITLVRGRRDDVAHHRHRKR